MRESPVDAIWRIAEQLRNGVAIRATDAQRLQQPLRLLDVARREILPPVVRVQQTLHPWVAFGIMPLFALANAGVSIDGVDLSVGGAQNVMLGVIIALLFGKPLGICGATWLMLKVGWCRLPPGVTWDAVMLVGLLAGIGFTMSIFIAMLAFNDERLLNAAKLGVLLGSLMAATIGTVWGALFTRRLRSIVREASECCPNKWRELPPQSQG
jgi:NhaA family Na+:H+ antiporter